MSSDRTLEILVISSEADTADTLRRIGGSEGLNMTVDTSTTPTAGPTGQPDAVFADAEILRTLSTGMPSPLSTTFGDAEVYVLAKETSVDTVRQFMKAGAVDVWSNPVDEASARRELNHLVEKKTTRMDSAVGSIVAFTNVKGGAGATTLAVNVAHCLAHKEGLSVLLVDLDIQFGGVGTFLDLQPSGSVIEVLAQSQRLDSALLRSLSATHESGLQILAAPAKPANLDAVKIEDLQRFFDVASHAYDLVILDVPRVLLDWTRETWRWSDRIFLVLQGSVAELRDSKILLADMAHNGITSERLHFVQNRRGTRHGSTDPETIRKTLGIDDLHGVRSDYAASSKAQNAGKPLLDIATGSVMTRDIHALARTIETLCDVAPRRRPGILARLFGGKHK